MTELDLPKATDLVRRLVRYGMPLDEALMNNAVPERFHDEIRRAVQGVVLQDPVLRPDHQGDWIDRIREDEWYHWERLSTFLATQLHRPPEVVDQLDEWSLRILSKLPDPRSSRFNSRGLVVGYVQSGKTANYTALAARAADAGYKLVVILTGLHNSLRAQTQLRLDQELTGHEVPEGFPRVELPDRSHNWIRMTTGGSDGDFDPSNHDTASLHSVPPVLIVMKKFHSVLRRFVDWLRLAHPAILADTPTLVIDDEADQASINTGTDRDRLAFVDEEREDEEMEQPDPEQEPSTTNRLLRDLLGILPRAAYVGYTATPFANILIHPEAMDREVGEDLYPKDFILQLPRPAEYIGTRELFGTMLDDPGRDALRFVPVDEVHVLRPARIRDAEGGDFQPRMVPSLRNALLDFLIAGAVRRRRGHDSQPNTMLVHISHLTAVQELVHGVLSREMQAIRGEWSHPGGRGEFCEELQRRWEEDIRPGLDDAEEMPFDCVEGMRAELDWVISEAELIELNSYARGELEYERGGNRQIIVVGGNRWSRGLTLEGLSVSYFLRTSGMCDTLLQMGRWYGYRRGYEDLLRIYTTDDLADWFAELAMVEEDLRDEIEGMNERGVNPRQMGVRIRCHSSMHVTAPMKMRRGRRIRVGYSCSHPQTILLPLQSRRDLDHNIDATRSLLASGSANPLEDGRVMIVDVPPEAVLDFIRSFRIPDQARSLQPLHLCEWIDRRVGQGDLIDWSVLVAGRRDGRRGIYELGGHDIGMVERTRLKGSLSIGTLIDPKDEAADLPGGDDSYRNASGTYNSRAMREARSPQQGLLLIYPISPDSSPSRRSNRIDLFDSSWRKPDCVIGYGLSLPRIDNAESEAIECVVGEHFAGGTE